MTHQAKPIEQNLDYFAEQAGIDIRHIEKHVDEDFKKHLNTFAGLIVQEYVNQFLAAMAAKMGETHDDITLGITE